jgi:hypothetical protein
MLSRSCREKNKRTRDTFSNVTEKRQGSKHQRGSQTFHRFDATVPEKPSSTVSTPSGVTHEVPKGSDSEGSSRGAVEQGLRDANPMRGTAPAAA